MLELFRRYADRLIRKQELSICRDRDAAGVLGVALSVDLLNLSKDVKWCPLGPTQESIVYSNVSSSGSVVTTVINKV